MEQTLWVSIEDGMLFPNEECAREGYRQWCEGVKELYDEDIFHECYIEMTFEEYNRDYAQ